VINQIEVDDDALLRLTSFTDEQLIEEIGRALAITVDGLLRAAMCVKLLDERGCKDLDRVVGKPLIVWLRRIAQGTMLPELFIQMQNSKWLSQYATLPIEDQRRLVAGEGITATVSRPDGNGAEAKVVTPREIEDSYELQRAVFPRLGHGNPRRQREPAPEPEVGKPIPSFEIRGTRVFFGADSLLEYHELKSICATIEERYSPSDLDRQQRLSLVGD
jgi:hypothetical protein